MVQGTWFKIYRHTKFHPHRTTSGVDMTSYPFPRWQPRLRSTTSGFASNNVTLFKSQNLSATKFRRYISTNDWDIAISVFGKQTSLELIPGCDFNHIAIIGMSFCTRVPNLIQIAPPAANMTSYRFLKMAAAAAQYYFWFPNCWYHFFRNKTLTTTRSQFVLTNHVRQPSIRIYKGSKSDQHIQIITKLALNWISGILRMKSYIENELKRNKIQKKI